MNKTSSKQAFRSISKQNGGMYCKKDIEIFTFFFVSIRHGLLNSGG